MQGRTRKLGHGVELHDFGDGNKYVLTHQCKTSKEIRHLSKDEHDAIADAHDTAHAVESLAEDYKQQADTLIKAATSIQDAASLYARATREFLIAVDTAFKDIAKVTEET